MPAKEVDVGPVGRRVGAAVRAQRSNKGMTLVDLSHELARLHQPINPNSLARLERGERRVDVDELVALAAALGMPAPQLLEGVVHATVRPQPARVSAAAGDARVIEDLAGRTPEEARWKAAWLRGEIPVEWRPPTAALAAVRFDDFLTAEEREAVLRGSAEAAAEAARRAYLASAVEMRARAEASATHPDPRTMTPEERQFLRDNGVDIPPDEELDS